VWVKPVEDSAGVAEPMPGRLAVKIWEAWVMDIVLGVSMAPASVQMVLLQRRKCRRGNGSPRNPQ
jgi:hypothetical protein